MTDEQRVLDGFLEKVVPLPAGDGRFIGRPEGEHGRLYGGFVAAQALVAACKTVDGAEVHSFHAYFVKLGRQDEPIEYEVERVRDGRSFGTRSVVARQSGTTIFQLLASFAAPEEGFGYQEPMPDVAPPADDVGTTFDIRDARGGLDLRRIDAERPIVARLCENDDPGAPGGPPPANHVWLRAKGAMPEDPLLHTALLTYATDESAAISAARPRRLVNERWFGASLDHAVWFHRPPRFDGWLMFTAQGAGASANRPLALGRIYTQSGVHIATVAQEALHRPHRDAD